GRRLAAPRTDYPQRLCHGCFDPPRQSSQVVLNAAIQPRARGAPGAGEWGPAHGADVQFRKPRRVFGPSPETTTQSKDRPGPQGPCVSCHLGPSEPPGRHGTLIAVVRNTYMSRGFKQGIASATIFAGLVGFLVWV